jgi:nicotinamidase-related amidase
MVSRNTERAAVAADNKSCSDALIIVDMISTWEFPDAEKLLPHARAIAPTIARLKSRFKRAGLPVIYANDNRGQWRSDFRKQVAEALSSPNGASITQTLRPDEDDYFVLKPSTSAFYGTPLDLLLRQLGRPCLLFAGVASDQCVLASVSDALMHAHDVRIPRDCIASQSLSRLQQSIRHFAGVLKLPVGLSSRLKLGQRLRQR